MFWSFLALKMNAQLTQPKLKLLLKCEKRWKCSAIWRLVSGSYPLWKKSWLSLKRKQKMMTKIGHHILKWEQSIFDFFNCNLQCNVCLLDLKYQSILSVSWTFGLKPSNSCLLKEQRSIYESINSLKFTILVIYWFDCTILMSMIFHIFVYWFNVFSTAILA